MTQEEKQLLLKDLCGRLPYDVLYAEIVWEDGPAYEVSFINTGVISNLICDEIKSIKPYLRPMSSMTEAELSEFSKLFNKWHDKELFDYIEEEIEFSIWKHKGISPVVFDWLTKHHFDYRGLIEKGFALEAPVDMYTNN